MAAVPPHPARSTAVWLEEGIEKDVFDDEQSIDQMVEERGRGREPIPLHQRRVAVLKIGDEEGRDHHHAQIPVGHLVSTVATPNLTLIATEFALIRDLRYR